MKRAVPCSPAVVGEPEEGEGFGSLLATRLPRYGRKAPELDHPRLLLVEL